MKPNSTLSAYRKFFLYLAILLVTAGLISCSATEEVRSAEQMKSRVTLKERHVKIYPDLVKKMMHVKNKENTLLDFFVFESDGTLIRHLKMEENDHKKLAGLKKGKYVYQVFKGDEMSESGKLIIK